HIQYVADLVSNGFLGGPGNLRAVRVRGHAENRSARIGRPVGSAQSRESGNEIDATIIGDAGGKLFNFSGSADEAELIFQPLDGGGGKIDDAFESVNGPATMHPRQGRDRAAF